MNDRPIILNDRPIIPSFAHIAQLLEEASWSLDHKTRCRESATIVDESAWLATDQLYRDTLDAICTRWSANRGPFVDMPPLQEYFLWVRFFAGAEFLHQCEMPKDTTLLPYPKVNEQTMIQWILVDWWNQQGRDAALYAYQFPFDKHA